MRDCAHFRALLFDFSSGKLEKELGEQVKRHIDECESCRKEYEAQRFYFENLPAVSEYLCNSDKDIKTAVMQKIKEEKENPPVYVPKRFHFSYGTAASLVLVAALFIFAMKTGIADKNGFDGMQLSSSECAVEQEAADTETALEEYGYTTATATGGSGAVYDDAAYFAVNDTYSSAPMPEERVIMKSAAPASMERDECDEEALTESVSAENETVVQYDEVLPLTLEKLREIIARKGENMTWADFEGHEYSDIGSGIYIYRYPINEDFYLTISGIPDSAPFEIRLVSAHNEENFITLPDGDIDSFIDRTAN